MRTASRRSCRTPGSTASCSTGPRGGTTGSPRAGDRPAARSPQAQCEGADLPAWPSRKLAGTVGVEVATLADEFIWILEDTASFIAGRVQAAIERYLEALLPPYAAALARYDREREYSWAAPGHQGGVAFLKSPVGRVFFDFFGENLFRTDMGIERGALGSLLGHSGPVGESERYAARIFGAQRSYSVAQRHLGFQSRHHVRVRRRRRDRAVRPQLPQVDRAGPGDLRRHPGVPACRPAIATASSGRSRRSSSSPRRSRSASPTNPLAQASGRQARGLFGADQLHL